MTALDTAVTVVFIVIRVLWWPISKLLALLLFILSPIYRVATFILLPFMHVGQTIINILSFPFSVKWLERIEV